MSAAADVKLVDFKNIFSLEGKVAVVTGGSRGLGLHAASGYVLLNDIVELDRYARNSAMGRVRLRTAVLTILPTSVSSRQDAPRSSSPPVRPRPVRRPSPP
jgi:hypothetical protein